MITLDKLASWVEPERQRDNENPQEPVMDKPETKNENPDCGRRIKHPTDIKTYA